MIHQDSFTVTTRGRGTYEVTEQVGRIVDAANMATGLCHVFVHHTSASLMLCENADPTVRHDLEAFMNRTVPDGDPLYRHTLEGPDDMPAHIRTVLTQTGLAIPVRNAHCDLGTWQGIYLWEHRTAGHTRKLTVTVQGA
jgi:secondary thiamine-phosphate synthase enzyme